MKTQKNSFRFAVRKAVFTLAAALAVAATQVTMAAGPEPEASSLQSAVFQIPNSLKFKTVVAPREGKLSITIRNENNEVMYSENLKSDKGYIRTFDFSTLADGQYTFVISNGQQTQSKTFVIETTTARVASLN